MNAGTEWRSRAACLDVEPELFFPAAECGPVYDAQVAAAKAACARCPVTAECLAEALLRMPYGIAGGLTAEERRTRRRPQPARVRVTPAQGRASEHQPAGLVLLAAGRPVRDVARCLGVSERTAQRWAALVRATATDPPDHEAEESRGGNRAPLQTSPTPNPPAGTRTQEGPEV